MKIHIPDYDMAYEESGNGLPVLFIHGYPLNKEIWRPQIEDLHDDGHILAIDLRGHGESNPLPSPYKMEVLADDCKAFLDAKDIKQQVVICGLSMGGYIAMAFCRRYLSQLAGLILVATRASVDSPETKKNRDVAIESVYRDGALAMINPMISKLLSPNTHQDNPSLIKQLKVIMSNISIEGILGDLSGMKERPDSFDILRQVKLPALIIHGADDQIIPLQEAKAMQAVLTYSRIEIIPSAGHLPNLEQPAIFNNIIRNYLKSLQKRGSHDWSKYRSSLSTN